MRNRGRKLPEKLDYVPRWFGYSVGKWEGDTFSRVHWFRRSLMS